MTGPAGAAGPAGNSGSTRVVGAAVTSGTNPAADTIITATVTCAAGKVALGGGGAITTSSAGQNNKVALRASYPSTAAVWTVEAIATANVSGGNTVTVTPYVLCSP